MGDARSRQLPLQGALFDHMTGELETKNIRTNELSEISLSNLVPVSVWLQLWFGVILGIYIACLQ